METFLNIIYLVTCLAWVGVLARHSAHFLTSHLSAISIFCLNIAMRGEDSSVI